MESGPRHRMKTSLLQVINSGLVPPDDRVGRFTSGHGSFRGELSVMAFLEPAQTFSTFIHKRGFSPSRSWLPLSSFVILSIIYATLSKNKTNGSTPTSCDFRPKSPKTQPTIISALLEFLEHRLGPEVMAAASMHASAHVRGSALFHGVWSCRQQP